MSFNYPDDFSQAAFDRYHSHMDDPYEADTDETPEDYGEREEGDSSAMPPDRFERHSAGCVCADCSSASLDADND